MSVCVRHGVFGCKEWICSLFTNPVLGCSNCDRLQKELDIAHKHIQDMQKTNGDLTDRISGKTGYCAQCDQYAKTIKILVAGLESIRMNSCCAPCREAGLWAGSTLEAAKEGK